MTNPRPILLGYIRADMLSTAGDLAAAVNRLEVFAATEEYTLGTVYVDQDEVTSALDALRDEVDRNEDTLGLVVPDGHHLAEAEARAIIGMTVLVAGPVPETGGPGAGSPPAPGLPLRHERSSAVSAVRAF